MHKNRQQVENKSKNQQNAHAQEIDEEFSSRLKNKLFEQKKIALGLKRCKKSVEKGQNHCSYDRCR